MSLESLSIEDMQLAPNARTAARILLAKHPYIVFTSGRRDIRRQANAMAVNVVNYGPSWLGQTYKNRAMVDTLTTWISQHPEMSGDRTSMGNAFYHLLVDKYAGDLYQFPHCRGDAFDIDCPRNADGSIDELRVSAIKDTIHSLPIELGLQLVLTKEGSHRVIHAQFNHAVEPIQA